jgi:hypothetical protein
MGIFDFRKPKDNRYVSEEASKVNLSKQIAGLPRILGVIKGHCASDPIQLKLEFFFYTNSIDKAKLLAEDLKQKSCSVEYRVAAQNSKLFVINGWTSRFNIEGKMLVSWVKEMCELGYKYDCDFDGWGTDLKQKDSI